MAGTKNGGGDFGFEAELFKAADKLRGNLEPSEYKHIALGLIFLKYISEAFEVQHAKLSKEGFRPMRKRPPSNCPATKKAI
jgi:type I restriction enzyme M protein